MAAMVALVVAACGDDQRPTANTGAPPDIPPPPSKMVDDTCTIRPTADANAERELLPGEPPDAPMGYSCAPSPYDSGILGEEDRRKAVGIALSDRRVAALLRGRRVVSAEARDDVRPSAVVVLTLDRPQAVEGVWFRGAVIRCFPASLVLPDTAQIAYRAEYSDVGALYVHVDLNSGEALSVGAGARLEDLLGRTPMEWGDRGPTLVGEEEPLPGYPEETYCD